MKEQLPLSTLEFHVAPSSLLLFTTVLQSGIEVKAASGTSLGSFLGAFPGFTAEYLAEVVQTIFLNGTAVDDLTIPLTGASPQLALSAAMPGLAGAIFRKNSFHAALRSKTGNSAAGTGQNGTITVILKLFNSIARDRGAELLRRGVRLRTETLLDFLARRLNLRQEIRTIRLNGQELDPAALDRMLAGHDKIHLSIKQADD